MSDRMDKSTTVRRKYRDVVVVFASIAVVSASLIVWNLVRGGRTKDTKSKKKQKALRFRDVKVGDVLYHRHQVTPGGVVIKVNRRDRLVEFLDFAGASVLFRVSKDSKSDMIDRPHHLYRMLGVKLNKKRLRREAESVIVQSHPSISGEYIRVPETRVFYSPNTNLYLYPGKTKSTSWRFGLEPSLRARFDKNRKDFVSSFHRVACLGSSKDNNKYEHPGDIGESTKWQSYFFDLPPVTTITRPEKQKYVSLSFPPTWSSLNMTQIEHTEKVVWKRASELFPGVGLCDQKNGFQETDACQGHLGTCYVLSCLSSLARTKMGKLLLKKMFRHNPSLTKPSPDGKYIVELHVFGKQQVVVDDFVPCVLNPKTSTFEPMFTYKKGGDELWPIIVEKALAKLYGSYVRHLFLSV
jgi:hypothetical protein